MSVCVFVSLKSRPIPKHLMRFRWKVMQNMNLPQLGMQQPMEMLQVLWQNFSNPSVVFPLLAITLICTVTDWFDRSHFVSILHSFVAIP